MKSTRPSTSYCVLVSQSSVAWSGVGACDEPVSMSPSATFLNAPMISLCSVKVCWRVPLYASFFIKDGSSHDGLVVAAARIFPMVVRQNLVAVGVIVKEL